MPQEQYTYPRPPERPDFVEQLTKEINKELVETIDRTTLAAIDSMIAFAAANGGKVTIAELQAYKRIVGLLIAMGHTNASVKDIV